ncbi:hypothetical protein [Longispora urticae]
MAAEPRALRVEAVAELPPDVGPTGWRYPAVSLSPGALRLSAADPRWRRHYLVARQGAATVGVLPVDIPLSDTIADAAYDLAVISARWSAPARLTSLAYLGGRQGLVSGVLVSTELSPAKAERACAALVSRGVAMATEAGRLAIAPYVQADTGAAFQAGFGSGASREVIGSASALRLRGTGPDDYRARLRRDQRQTLASDDRRFARCSLSSATVDAGTVVDEIAPMVTAVKAKYGLAEHPRFVALRLRRWIAAGAGRYPAFVVRDADAVVAATVCCHFGDRLEVHELGMAGPESPGRLSAYLEATIHAPLRYAYAHGCADVALGLAATTTKRKRGATVTDVTAFAAATTIGGPDGQQ